MELMITRALSELKMLDKRIKRAVNEATFGGLMIGKNCQTDFGQPKTWNPERKPITNQSKP
ncbi:hypothetical protein P4S97_01545 [Bacillus licheniformis]|nr:hypothetical protein [Bacillus licheniformis]MEC2365596.1 hypothetical protein [Bacillus licheniformis]MEC3535826.1 hypothetical protein [Bacillus licheniformis]MED0693235.1 hypothetical protein [Bacillus licheniformis]MED0791968.1 hypothetical protein [Bacillus licheniformis]MED0821711.1 hypothetical protein [Bacillus licheniformis]